jgi:hypothetical protein
VAGDLGVVGPKGLAEERYVERVACQTAEVVLRILVEGQHVVLVAYYVAEVVRDQVAAGKTVAGADAMRSGGVAEAAERAGLS